MKLTADHNQAPKKKKRKKSNKKITPIVQKNSDQDNSPGSEDSRPASNPFIYSIKQSEPHSPFSNSSNKSCKAEVVIEEEDSSTRFSYSPPDPRIDLENSNIFIPDSTVQYIPDNTVDRIKLMGLEMTNDATMFNEYVTESKTNTNTKTNSNSTPPQNLTDWGALGLQMSETKMNYSESFGSDQTERVSPVPAVAKRNIFQTQTPRDQTPRDHDQSATSQWARQMIEMLESDKIISKLFDENSAKFILAMEHVDLDEIREKVQRITSTLPIPSPTHSQSTHSNANSGSDSDDSIYEYQFNDFSMPALESTQ
jgi:hypothetical protein